MRATVEFEASYALLVVDLEDGESIKAEPGAGAMVTQTNVALSTRINGPKGIFGGLKNIMGGESFFINTFTGGHLGGQVTLAPSTPGDIGAFEVEPHRDLYIQSGSFLACTQNVHTDPSFQEFKGMFSGESLFFIRAYAKEYPGKVYYNSYGAIRRMPVQSGQELVVDTGHLVAFSEDVDYSIGKVGGIRSMVAGGEGLVMKFTGSGHVWVQTRNLQSLVDKIVPYLPLRKYSGRRPVLGDGGGPGCSAFKIHTNDSNDQCPRKQNLDISHQTFSDYGPTVTDSSGRRLTNKPESQMGTKKYFVKSLRRQKTLMSQEGRLHRLSQQSGTRDNRTYPREAGPAARTNHPRPGRSRPIFQAENSKPAPALWGLRRRFGTLAGHAGFQPRPQ